MSPPGRIRTEGFDRAELARTAGKAAACALAFLRCPKVRVNIYSISPQTARSFNAAFRKKRESAGVLSFPLPGPDPEGERGEILLCVGRIRKLAAKRSRTLKSMISFLTVHGVLHILGFHHDSAVDFELMTALERAIERDMTGKKGGRIAG